MGITIPRTASTQVKHCVDNHLTIGPDDLVPGDLIFFSHKTNGRFMNITHVAIYAGDGWLYCGRVLLPQPGGILQAD